MACDNDNKQSQSAIIAAENEGYRTYVEHEVANGSIVCLAPIDKATPLNPGGVCRHSHGHCKHCRATSNKPFLRVCQLEQGLVSTPIAAQRKRLIDVILSEKREVSKHQCLHCKQ